MIEHRLFKVVIGLITGVLITSTASAEIGTVSAVNRDMDGTPPEQTSRALTLGDTVYSNERIETSELGLGQLLFVDQTSLTVSPNSDIILDRYIYDPDRETGDMALSMTRGALRFIGGRISKSQAATIRTPTATIGIRGGMVLVEIDSDGTLITNIASESVVVEQYGDADGDGLDDGPSENKSASGGRSGGGSGGSTISTGGPTSRVVLTRSSATATASRDGATYTGLANSGDLAASFGTLEGAGDGGYSTSSSTSTVQTEADAGAQSVTSNNSGETGGYTNTEVNTEGGSTISQNSDVTLEPSAASIGDNTELDRAIADIAESVEAFDPVAMDNLPDPSDIAALTGTALYTGPANGTLVDLSGSSPVSGSIALLYDFDQRTGAFDLNILGNTFTTDVGADPANAANFAGGSPIFGGPDTVAATGGFRTDGSDPAVSVEGEFALDLQSQNRAVVGTYTGTK